MSRRDGRPEAQNFDIMNNDNLIGFVLAPLTEEQKAATRSLIRNKLTKWGQWSQELEQELMQVLGVDDGVPA